MEVSGVPRQAGGMNTISSLFRFKGGVKPDSHKDESAQTPIQRAPLPSQLIVPLRQSARAVARCVVEPG